MDVLAQLTAALLDRYALDREIGRGGMATVYLARDVRHNRKVALKVLNPELGAVLGVERFLAEIQVTANLQHPNLLPLFDSGEADGLLFYVMPFIEGESLRAQLLREKQLPVSDALHVAVSVANALDYAHRHGVIHRDLKPENILMHDGQPVIADFGIALAVSKAGGNRITQTGLSLGTPQYMSPEQATGDREIDGRTDIYSLGAMTYEMLVGEPPHDGKTSQAIIAKVLTDKPRNIRLARETVPLHVEAAVERALAKLPADRYHTAKEFADALGKTAPETALASTATIRELQRSGAASAASGLGKRLPWAVAAAAVGLAIVAWWPGARNVTDAVVPVTRYEVSLGAGMALSLRVQGSNAVAIAPHGRYVAFNAIGADNSRRLYLRSADALDIREVPGSVLSRAPFFSPDGQWVGFWASGRLLRAPVSGGAPVPIAELPTVSVSTWTVNDEIITSDGSRLLRLPAAGGAPVPFTMPDTAGGDMGHLNPVALPDGRHVLFTALGMGGAAGSRIGIASLDDGRSSLLALEGSYPLGVLDGHLIYTVASGAVFAVPIDVAGRRVTGSPVPLLEQVAAEVGAPLSYASLSPDGSLVFITGISQRQLVLAERNGGTRPITAEAGSFAHARYSPSGRHIAMTVTSATRSDVFIYTVPSGPLVRLTTEGFNNDRPEWADARTVTFRSNRGGLNSIWSQPIDGSSPARLLYGERDAKVDQGILSADGRYLLFQRDRVGLGEMWVRAMQGDTTPRRVGNGPFGEVGGRFSPDGKWVVFSSSELGGSQVFVRPFPALNARYQVSLDGGGTPVWSPDGRTIFYVTDRQLVAATIGSFEPFTVASRQVVLDRMFTFGGTQADYDVTRDGRAFAVFRSPDQGVQLVVVNRWGTEVASRLAQLRR